MSRYNEKYVNKLEYPSNELKKVSHEEYIKMRDLYGAETCRLEKLFREELAHNHGMDRLPQSIQDALYSKAWEEGHAYGYDEVASHYSDMAELVIAAYIAGVKSQRS